MTKRYSQISIFFFYNQCQPELTPKVSVHIYIQLGKYWNNRKANFRTHAPMNATSVHFLPIKLVDSFYRTQCNHIRSETITTDAEEILLPIREQCVMAVNN